MPRCNELSTFPQLGRVRHVVRHLLNWQGALDRCVHHRFGISSRVHSTVYIKDATRRG